MGKKQRHKKSKNRTDKNDLRIIASSFQTLLELSEAGKKIHKAEKREVEKATDIMKRFCDSKDIEEKMEQDKKIATVILQIKDLLSTLRSLLK